MNLEFGDNLKTWTLVSALFALVTIGIATANFIIPMPDAEKAERNGKEEVRKAKIDLESRQEALAKLQAGDPALWEGQAEAVTPQILQSVTIIAKTQGVTLKSFRPQNPVADGDLSRNNYVVLVEGPFPKVIAFTKAIDSAGSRLGVSLIQFASVDQESDAINATIGIVAYLKQPEPEKPDRSGTSGKDTAEQKDEKSTEPSNDDPKATSIPKDSK